MLTNQHGAVLELTGNSVGAIVSADLNGLVRSACVARIERQRNPDGRELPGFRFTQGSPKGAPGPGRLLVRLLRFHATFSRPMQLRSQRNGVRLRQSPPASLLPHTRRRRANALMGDKLALRALLNSEADVFAPCYPALALCSDPQCQTATHPLVTVASPAMTTRNCIPAMRFASGSSVTLQESLPRTDGRPGLYFPRCLCSPKREAERRTAHQQLPRLDAQARPRPGKRDRSPFGAPPRSCAGISLPTRPGPRFLEPPDANGRTLSGTSAASTSQSGTRRTG